MPIVVTGKILPIINGNRVSYMGGKEIYVSRDEHGPCLCIPKGKFIRKFPLKSFKVYSQHVEEGKMTVEVHNYLGNTVQLQISTDSDVPQLVKMKEVLNDRSQLKRIAPVKLEKGRGKLQRQFVSAHADGGPEAYEDSTHMVTNAIFNFLDWPFCPTPPDSLQDIEQNFLRQQTTLSEEQLAVVRHIKDGRNVFFTGCAGTGKTFLIKEIVKHFDANSTYVTASTGIAAVEVGGITLHAFAGIGLGNGDAKAWLERISHSERNMNYWKKCKLLIIDEISMIDGELFDKLDAVARILKNKPERPFGGIQLVLNGDFLQLPPVNKEKSSLSLAVVELTVVFRQSNQEFVDCLNAVRFGQISDSVRTLLKTCLQNKLDVSDGIFPTTLRALNKDVEQENFAHLDRLAGDKKVFTAADDGKEVFVKLLKQSSLFPDRLELKVGAQVMLLKNLTANRLGNGSRGVVVSFAPNDLPIVKFTNGTEVIVERDTQSLEMNRQTVATRRQLPLKLAWALTVHKCQGMEIDKLEVSLDSSVFECGQAYTALSRAKSTQGLKLAKFEESSIRAHPRVLEYYKKLGMNGPRGIVRERPQIPLSRYLDPEHGGDFQQPPKLTDPFTVENEQEEEPIEDWEKLEMEGGAPRRSSSSSSNVGRGTRRNVRSSFMNLNAEDENEEEAGFEVGGEESEEGGEEVDLDTEAESGDGSTSEEKNDNDGEVVQGQDEEPAVVASSSVPVSAHPSSESGAPVAVPDPIPPNPTPTPSSSSLPPAKRQKKATGVAQRIVVSGGGASTKTTDLDEDEEFLFK